MCSAFRKFTTTRWLLGLMVLAVIASTAPAAFAQCSGSAGPGFPASIAAGSTGVAATLVLKNTSETVALGGCGPVTATNIRLTPSCGDFPLSGGTCSGPGSDPGVFTVHNGTGRAGTACAAIAFTASIVNAGTGQVGFAPGSTVTLPITDATDATSCIIDFTVDALKVPTIDENTASATTIETGQLGSVVLTSTTNGALTGSGTGTDLTTVTFVCGVKVDKQISCDGGTTWADQGEEAANGDGNNGCIGHVGDNDIKVRYFAQNISTGGIALSTCNITESNSNLGAGVSTNFGIANNGVNGVASTQETGVLGLTAPDPLVCETARGTSEPDTAGVDCTCVIPALATPPHATASDGAKFDCCGVAVDKQVSCDNGVTWADAANAAGGTLFETANGDGTNSCNALFGASVKIRYFAKNTGTVDLTCNTGDNQGLHDTYIVNSGQALALTSESISVVTGTIGPIANPNVTTCNDALRTNEASGDKATIDCSCSGATGPGDTTAVSAFDQARINCQNAVFTTDKSCVPTTPGGTTFDTTVNVHNTGDIQLSCTIVDQYVTGVCGSLPSCPLSGGTPVSLVTDPVVVASLGNGSETGSFTSASTVCNEACITCTPSGGSALPPQAAIATCPVGTGCFSRTPGYWGTHPNQTQTVLNQGAPGLVVCGVNLTTTLAGVSGSATEDLCESGKDFKNNNTTPQQLQLIRQCTAAALNLEASRVANLGCETADPGITVAFNNCCVGTSSTCDSGKSSSQIDASGCIGTLDAFNNQFETTDFPGFLTNTSAQPAQCKAANGNGFVNPGRTLGSK
jgi:hypothetical protein